MNFKCFLLVSGVTLYLTIPSESLAGAWKRVQQCDDWDQVARFINIRVTDLTDDATYKGSEVDEFRLALWQARQAAVSHAQSEIRSPDPETLHLLLTSLDQHDKVIEAKSNLRIAKHREKYIEIPDIESSPSREMLEVREPGFTGQGDGVIYRLPIDRKGKQREERPQMPRSELMDFDEDQWERDIKLAIQMSLEEMRAKDKKVQSIPSSLTPGPDDGIDEAALEYEDL